MVELSIKGVYDAYWILKRLAFEQGLEIFDDDVIDHNIKESDRHQSQFFFNLNMFVDKLGDGSLSLDSRSIAKDQLDFYASNV